MADSDNSDTAAELLAEIKALSIHQRIFAIMDDVGALEPDSEVKIGNSGGYPYISHDAVTAHIKPMFMTYRVMVLPTVLEHIKDGNRTELKVETSFINIDDPSDKISVLTVGYGVDPSDKGPGKAMSYATKVAYLKLLMLNSQDDEGGVQTDHDPADTRTSEVDDAQAKARKSIEASASTYKAAIDGATSKKELQELKRKNGVWLVEAPDVTREYFDNAHNDRLQAIEASGE